MRKNLKVVSAEMHFQTCYGGEGRGRVHEVNEMIIINTIIGPGNEVPMERVLGSSPGFSQAREQLNIHVLKKQSFRPSAWNLSQAYSQSLGKEVVDYSTKESNGAYIRLLISHSFSDLRH